MTLTTNDDSISNRGALILVSLADGGPKHGYALMQDIEGFAGVKLGPGTLYGALQKLEDDGMIDALVATDRRQPYRITPAGQQALSDRLSETARVARLGLGRITRRGSR